MQDFSNALFDSFLPDEDCYLDITLEYGHNNSKELLSIPSAGLGEIVNKTIEVINSLVNKDDLDALSISIYHNEDEEEYGYMDPALHVQSLFTDTRRAPDTPGGHYYITDGCGVDEPIIDALAKQYEKVTSMQEACTTNSLNESEIKITQSMADKLNTLLRTIVKLTKVKQACQYEREQSDDSRDYRSSARYTKLENILNRKLSDNRQNFIYACGAKTFGEMPKQVQDAYNKSLANIKYKSSNNLEADLASLGIRLREDFDDDYYDDDKCSLSVALAKSSDTEEMLCDKVGTKEELTQELINIINSVQTVEELDALDVIFVWLDEDDDIADDIFSLSSIFTNGLGEGPGNHDYLYNDDEVAEEVIGALTAKYQALQ